MTPLNEMELSIQPEEGQIVLDLRFSSTMENCFQKKKKVSSSLTLHMLGRSGNVGKLPITSECSGKAWQLQGYGFTGIITQHSKLNEYILGALSVWILLYSLRKQETLTLKVNRNWRYVWVEWPHSLLITVKKLFQSSWGRAYFPSK